MDSKTTEAPKLKKEVSDKYNLVKIQPGLHFVPGFGEVDLAALDVAAADKLVKRKFPYLKAKAQRLHPPKLSE